MDERTKDPKATPNEEKPFELQIGGESVRFTAKELVSYAQKCTDELAARKQTDADGEDFAALIAQFPELDELPDEVGAKIREGKKPLDAYREYEFERMRKELEDEKKKKSNKQSTPGSVRGDGEGDPDTEELLAIFNSVFR